MTTPEQLRAIVEYLEERVRLVTDGDRAITFDPCTVEEIADEGLDLKTFTSLTSAPWWSEMVEDIIQTPDFAEPDATPSVVLSYARDVIREYIGKMFEIDP